MTSKGKGLIRKRFLALVVLLLLSRVLSPWPQRASAQSNRFKYQAGDHYLIVEFLDDDLVHLELSPHGPGPDVNQPIYTTPMVYKTDYPGPSNLVQHEDGALETPEIRVQVSPETLCVTVTDTAKEPDLTLTTVCPVDLDQPWKGISLTPESFTHAYGLGQQFIQPGTSEGDWVGRVRSAGEMGNTIVEWNGGAVGNAQFPILYLAGAGTDSYALFMDNQYKQTWDLTGEPWTGMMGGDWLRFYVMTGPDLKDLRADYMELVGRPPVPPKKMFGLWVSEYGYDNWEELEDKLRTLRANGFPVDGFVLDLEWFGGVRGGSDDSPTGSLTWDEEDFPDSEARIAALREGEGVGIMLIEHAYVSRNLPEHEQLEQRGYLVRECEDCGPSYIEQTPYWGKGGMIDWTNSLAGAFWHDWKREPLIAVGVMGHWIDLGEPQMYDESGWYWGLPGDHKPQHGHDDVHNLYSLEWSQSIYQGYLRNGHDQRPFILSRSGTSGIQRYGVSMWSADIGARLSGLSTHLNAQLHMSMSGIDYYGSDIGGFYRDALLGDLNETYTQWFADGTALDVPIRPHTYNLCNCNETAPDRVGDLQSNLENLRQRYELSPYLYSLAHRAYRYGEPIAPPLVYYYQGDPVVREMGHEKMLGRDMLIAVMAQDGEHERQVYLPAGAWVDYHTGQSILSPGAWYGPFPAYRDGRFKLPIFVRAGAILPQMYVDDKTMNIMGQRTNGTRRDELIVQVYPDASPSSFTLYEDDGQTMAYQSGAVRTIVLYQVRDGEQVNVVIGGADGSYAGAPETRDNVVELIAGYADRISEVTLNGAPLPRRDVQAEFDASPNGWYRAGPNLILAKSGQMDVAQTKTFAFHFDFSLHFPVSVQGHPLGDPAEARPESSTGKTLTERLYGPIIR